MQVYKSAGEHNEYVVTLCVLRDTLTNFPRKNAQDLMHAKYRCADAIVLVHFF